jgi:lipopolysaccharide/colanic/teichoic acid biosynthesis glycosyltransferase
MIAGGPLIKSAPLRCFYGDFDQMNSEMNSGRMSWSNEAGLALRGGLRHSMRRRLMCQLRRFAPVARAAAKRAMDIVVAATMLMLLSPLFLLLAALIKGTDGGPILYWQDRVGKFGRTFRFPKFRSMVVNAEALLKKLEALNQHGSGVTFKMKRDPRITWVGRFIRRASIDELPQLWCVLKGEMSLVGPRPPLVREVVRYSLLDRRRLEVVPGLTCFWQVQGRSEIPFPRQVELDVEYIENHSLSLDLKLLVQTVPAVIGGRGAY